jgi:hypothetical protein
MGKRFDETFLHGIESIRLVAEKPMRYSVSQQAITAEQFLQGLSFPVGKAREQTLVTWGWQTGCGNNGPCALSTPHGTDGHISSLIQPEILPDPG